MSLDLNKLENKLDEALSNETTETLTKFLNDKRMKNNKQQTAVQQFWDKIALKLSFEQIDEFVPLFYQAKEMEKEQKRKDFTDGYMHGNEPLNHDVIDKWYNETYGGNK
jgi:hypothetical protein